MAPRFQSSLDQRIDNYISLHQARSSGDNAPQEQQRRDISENGIDENVHWFANPNTETLNWPRSQEPFVPNGSSSKAHKNVLMQRRDGDISEKGIDEDVHDFVNNQP